MIRQGAQIPGFGEGEIKTIDTSLKPEVSDPDPLHALVTLLFLIEISIALFFLNWIIPVVAVLLVALTYFVPPPNKVGGFIPQLIGRPLQPLRWLFDRLFSPFNPNQPGARQEPRREYSLDLKVGMQQKFTVKGDLLPRNPAQGEYVRIWTIQRQGRAYFRQGELIEKETQEKVMLQLLPSYVGRYYLLALLFLNLGVIALRLWVFR